MLRVWGRRSSFNVQKVMWLIGELDLRARARRCRRCIRRARCAAFRAMNPHGRVPVVRDDDATVWESHAILRYLAACHGNGRFWSDDPVVRARVDGWMDWSQTALQPDFLGGVFWGFFRTPESQRDWLAIHKALARCEQHFAKLERLLEATPFLLGETLSLADFTAGTSLYRYFELEIARPPLPAVERWYQRLQQRPPFRKHVMLPFEELRGRLDY
ncbi:glutathione S-transferase N-terminal domain-containing protein [Bradyrhizobium altum]|uniref:glutathione S-transferase N-terminal domain-containing protein n=1 Tax=Bradyrhizobium altum TaxID=1571202 RepID=UPI0024BF2BC4|nr:glutathione S-transferase N-terminal domain-containing protein [Bradyrhizobium altum]